MSAAGYFHAAALMGTVVSIQIAPRHDRDNDPESRRAVTRALDWFRAVEAACNRFDPSSEIRRMAAQPGVALDVSPMLFEAVQFALHVAEETGGAFDPTVGLEMERRGFTHEYQSGRVTASSLAPDDGISFRDVDLDPAARTITLRRPLLLDLGAVAKGLAIDMAARELAPFEHFAIEAGGDLYLSGLNPDGEPWSVGIRHPRAEGHVLATLHVSNTAVCTSGDYERRSPIDDTPHVVDARTHRPADTLASVTVLAPSAMVADALATAAFVLGPIEGLELLERSGVEGLLVSPELERFSTRGMPGAAVLRHA